MSRAGQPPVRAWLVSACVHLLDERSLEVAQVLDDPLAVLSDPVVNHRHQLALDLSVAVGVRACRPELVRGTWIPWRARSVDAFLAWPLAIPSARRPSSSSASDNASRADAGFRIPGAISRETGVRPPRMSYLGGTDNEALRAGAGGT